ncbi:hypothetical protein L204_100460 [Cryptococcus depauperatus]
MNSYPIEFLAHPRPLMFVAGLDQSSDTDCDTLIGNDDMNNSDSQFTQLISNLRTVFSSLKSDPKIWLRQRERKDFCIILVDKAVRLPMRKIQPSDSSATPDALSSPHSPLSPLISSSPLYPDGLIAPVWVRKHAELVPSVFILFLRLYESPPIPKGLETAEEKEKRETQEKEKEKEMDDLLVKQIGDRRRRLGERGIKLTVVLMASFRTLDSPALDPRLSFVRRASSLSSKASLFVLSPVAADQLPDFISSIQEALYDSALEYYTAHSKRVRRKKNRAPASQPSHSPITTSRGQKALSPQGWAVRYDWKMGWFAEVRGEIDVARRHYEDCWNELAKMFSSTTILSPRTKRWAEAKVLADCVAIRICKLALYDSEGSRALASFYVHVKRFGDFSKGWGIGEETFEYWSWIARQYRIFAELLEMAQSHGLHTSTPVPSFPTLNSSVISQDPEYFVTPLSSTNPSQTLQHPAMYYYTAACCSIERYKRFKEALEVESDALDLELGKTSGFVSAAPGFANEKKVDHTALVIELFSKAYLLLKDHNPPFNRLALYVAFRIASTYHQANQHDMAVRFFDRISTSFKKDKWTEIVKTIKALWYKCSKETGDIEEVCKLSLEMMCGGSDMDMRERKNLQEELLSMFETTTPTSTESIVMEMSGEEGMDLLDVRVGFWQSEAAISKSVAYQVVLHCHENVIINDLKFASCEIIFSDNRLPVILTPSIEKPEQLQDDPVRIVSTEDKYAPLQWRPGQNLVINGYLTNDSEGEVSISGIKLSLVQRAWLIDLIFTPGNIGEWQTKNGSLRADTISEFVHFKPQPHRIHLEAIHHPSTYVNDMLPIELQIRNNDERGFDAQLSIFLQPGEDGDDDGSSIKVEDRHSATLIQSIPLPRLETGSKHAVFLQLCSPPKVSTKIIDFSLQSTFRRSPPANATPSNAPLPEITEETNHTIVIPVLQAFIVETTIKWTHKGKEGGKAMVGIDIKLGGLKEVIVESLELIRLEKDDEIKQVLSSLDTSEFPQTWNLATSYGAFVVFDVTQGHRGAVGIPTEIPAQLAFTWKSDPLGASVKTTYPLPPLRLPPPTDSFLISTLHLPSPSSVSANIPFPVILSIFNTHPNHPAAQVTVTVEIAENFVFVGDRAIHIPPILSNQKVDVQLDCVNVGGSRWVKIPRISVWDGEGEDKEEVRVRGDTMIFVRP